MNAEQNPEEAAGSDSTGDSVDDLAETILDLLEKLYRLYVGSPQASGSSQVRPDGQSDTSTDQGTFGDDLYEEVLKEINQLDEEALRTIKRALNTPREDIDAPEMTPADPSGTTAFNQSPEKIREQAYAEGFEEGYESGVRDALIQVKDQLREEYLRSSIRLFLFGEVDLDPSLEPDGPDEASDDDPSDGEDA